MLTLTSPVETPLHRIPAGLKLAALCGFTVWLFAAPGLLPPGLLPLGISLAAVGTLYAAGGALFATTGLWMLWPLWPFILIVGLWHGLTGAVLDGLVIILRMVAAVAAANLVTMTTRLEAMIRVVEALARPLAALGLPPRRLALAVALMIRFIPVLSQNAARISEAWRARSPRRPRWRTLPALTLSAIDDADRVAEALRARGGVG
jgi:biotin transport system permease protein